MDWIEVLESSFYCKGEKKRAAPPASGKY